MVTAYNFKTSNGCITTVTSGKMVVYLLNGNKIQETQ